MRVILLFYFRLSSITMLVSRILMNTKVGENPRFPKADKALIRKGRYAKLMMGLVMISIFGGYGYMKYLDHLEYKRQGKWNLLEK